MKKKCLAVIAIWFLIFGLVGLANATTVYNNEAAFLTAIDSTYYLEDFDSFAYQSYGASLGFGPVNSFSYTIAASLGLFGGSGNMSTNTANDQLTITFTGADVTAIGGFFWPTDFDGENLIGDITLSLSDGTNFTASNADSSTFTGFTTDTATFTSMSISSLGSSVSPAQWPTVDHLYVGTAGTPIPEPATMLLFGVGLLGVAGASRRKK